MTYDEFCKLATDQSNKALREIRDAFHFKWGAYYKCANCGGRIESLRDRLADFAGTKCIHGDHECVVIVNGYSYPDRDIERKLRARASRP